MPFVDEEAQVEHVGVTAPNRAEAPDVVEFDYADEGAPEDTREVEALAEGKPSMPDVPDAEDDDGPTGVGVSSALMARIEAAEAAAAEAQAELARVRGAAPEAVDDKPPKPEAEITTAQDVVEHMKWELKKAMRDMQEGAAVSASQAASEQRARGMLNKREMGDGFDYDSIITRHIAPIEKANPRARALFSSQRDPALARYAMGLVLAAIDKYEGDPVKAFKELRRAIDGKVRGGEELIERIQKAERTGATRLKNRRTGPTGTRSVTSADIDAMTPREFLEFKNDMKAGRVRQAS